MSETTDRAKEYRGYAAIGGGFFGAIVGIVSEGVQIANGDVSFLLLLAIVASAASLGALIGYGFIGIFSGSLVVNGPVRQSIGMEDDFLEQDGHETHSGHEGHTDTGIGSDH